MERDFMGLGTKATPITVKEEISDGSKDSVLVKGSGMQLSFSDKASAIPQFLSFKAAQEDTPRKMVHDSLVSPGFMSISNSDGMVQKNMILDKQGGTHYAMTTYALPHFDANHVHRTQEVRMFPVSGNPSQTITVSMSSPVLYPHVASTGQNVVGNPINSQPLGAVSVIHPASILPTSSSIIGTTELRNAPKYNAAPAQLTIFYNGSVCVYDDVSPEKAQAIMLLAGNGSSVTHNKTVPAAQMQALIPGPSASNGFARNDSHYTQLSSGLQDPISAITHVGSQSAGGPSCTNESAMIKPISVFAPSTNQLEPNKAFSSIGPATSLVPAVPVPQARKASLARFLEKRKERAMCSSPYTVTKKSPDCSSNGSEGLSISVNSSGSHLLPATNEQSR